jgi:hypothetical protein
MHQKSERNLFAIVKNVYNNEYQWYMNPFWNVVKFNLNFFFPFRSLVKSIGLFMIGVRVSFRRRSVHLVRQ